MGAWSSSITGNDTVRDLKPEYDVAFYYYDVDTAVSKIEEFACSQGIDESDEAEWCNYIYPLADFMWNKGILTEAVRHRALDMIDAGIGLDVWAESGEKMLEHRKKALCRFREKLLSPQPPKKKIRIKLYMSPIFEIGDLIAIQLKTMDKTYLPSSRFDEAFFRACHDQWVVLRKIGDMVSYSSAIVPEVRDIWPVFQLYGEIYDICPSAEQLESVPWARFRDSENGIFICEGSMSYFKKRNYRIIGKNSADIASVQNNDIDHYIWFGINKSHANADTSILSGIIEC